MLVLGPAELLLLRTCRRSRQLRPSGAGIDTTWPPNRALMFQQLPDCRVALPVRSGRERERERERESSSRSSRTRSSPGDRGAHRDPPGRPACGRTGPWRTGSTGSPTSLSHQALVAPHAPPGRRFDTRLAADPADDAAPARAGEQVARGSATAPDAIVITDAARTSARSPTTRRPARAADPGGRPARWPSPSFAAVAGIRAAGRPTSGSAVAGGQRRRPGGRRLVVRELRAGPG